MEKKATNCHLIYAWCCISVRKLVTKLSILRTSARPVAAALQLRLILRGFGIVKFNVLAVLYCLDPSNESEREYSLAWSSILSEAFHISLPRFFSDQMHLFTSSSEAYCLWLTDCMHWILNRTELNLTYRMWNQAKLFVHSRYG